MSGARPRMHIHIGGPTNVWHRIASLALIAASAAPPLFGVEPCIDYRQYVHTLSSLPAVNGDEIAFAGDLAFVVRDWSDSMAIIDVSAPKSLRLIRKIPLVGRRHCAVAAAGGYLYIGSQPGLDVYDINDPLQPRYVRSVAVGATVCRISLRPPFAFATGDSGVAVLDISDPSSPQQRALVPGVEAPWVMDGDVLCGKSGFSVQLFDVGDPLHPVHVGNLPPGWLYPNTLVMSPPFLYMTGYDPTKVLNIYDISDPAAPVQRARVPGNWGYRAVAGDGRLYTGTAIEGMLVLDVSDATQPVVLTRFDVAEPSTLHDGLLYGFHSGRTSFGLFVADVSRPVAPGVRGRLRLPGEARGAWVRTPWAYVADHTGLRIVDVADPSRPVLAGGLDLAGEPEDVATAGNHAYVAASTAGLHVVDVSDPHAPWHVQTIPVIGSAVDVVVSNGHLLVATDSSSNRWNDEKGDLLVFDVSTPESPQLLSRTRVGDRVHHLAASGRYATVATWTLHLFDVTNPALPVFLGEHFVPDGARNGALNDRNLFGVDGQHGWFLTYEFDQPGGNLLDTVSGCQAIAAAGSIVYLGCPGSIDVIDVAQPQSPFIRRVAMLPTPNDIEAQDGIVYVAAGSAGLLTLTAECDVTTPVALADLTAVAVAGGIRLQWRVADGDFDAFRVARARRDGPAPETFEVLAAGADLPGHPPWEFLDREVVPGGRYAYRVEGRLGNGAVVVAGPVEATAGAATGAWMAAMPNPVRDGVVVRFSLPWRTPVTLQVFDLAGRLVHLQRMASTDPGVRNLHWDGRDGHGRRVASGVYFLRLESSRWEATRRLTLVH